ncbi:MAG: class I SAM-dependent RNA methyltransferase [Clostridioides sp.]|jgi:putative N6-adenine-specific DNA methylase|nr:class I SAM-dependent RNA methyltransferase [Clostridioides sp.]
MRKSYTLVAPCFFGMEAMLAREIRNLGFEIITTQDGRVTYKTDETGIAKSNLWIRCAERIQMKVAEFDARTFDDLYENTKRIDWTQFIPYGAKFPIHKASSINSQLRSTPNIQSIVKKAIADSLKKGYLESGMLVENKEEYPIFVFIHKDKVVITIDTTGDALHKRGYREKANKAPIRETIAAGLVSLTPWKKGRLLVDPMCGSGTILIEAAMMALNMAPGLNREFISETWRTYDKKIWWQERKSAYEKIDESEEFKIYGYDIDPESIEIARENAEIAGVSDYIEFNVADATKFNSKEEYGFIITNPPYGERLEDEDSVKFLYNKLGHAFSKLKNWSYYIITSFEEFEYEFGKTSDKKRKLYNGKLKTYYYQYNGPKPPKGFFDIKK